MRKAFAISLLVVYLFNLAGYQLLFHYFMASADESAVATLDKAEFNREDLLEIKVPLNMPYVTGTSDYERVDGQVKVQHVFYNYVMRRVHRDTLYLLCKPNLAKTNLSNNKVNYGKLANDLPTGKKHNDGAVKKGSSSNEYTCTAICYQVLPLVQPSGVYGGFWQVFAPSSFTHTPWQPPQVA